MASTLAASVLTTWSVHKMQEAERWVKFKGNRKRSGEETGNHQRESCSANIIHTKRREIKSEFRN